MADGENWSPHVALWPLHLSQSTCPPTTLGRNWSWNTHTSVTHPSRSWLGQTFDAAGRAEYGEALSSQRWCRRISSLKPATLHKKLTSQTNKQTTKSKKQQGGETGSRINNYTFLVLFLFFWLFDRKSWSTKWKFSDQMCPTAAFSDGGAFPETSKCQVFSLLF